MNDKNACTADRPLNILVFQQNGRGESKVKGIRQYGGRMFDITLITIDEALPPVVERKLQKSKLSLMWSSPLREVPNWPL